MRTPKKFLVLALATVLAVGSFGAAAAIGENALVEEPRAQAALSVEQSRARAAALAEQSERAAAIEYAGAVHTQRLEDYALVVYLQEVERAEAAAAAAAAVRRPPRTVPAAPAEAWPPSGPVSRVATTGP